MYSATFAMTVIAGIACTNLFLGFATAILFGRGPKSWADAKAAIDIQLFSPNLFLLRNRKRVERIELPMTSTATKVPAVEPAPTPVQVEPPSAKPSLDTAELDTMALDTTASEVTEPAPADGKTVVEPPNEPRAQVFLKPKTNQPWPEDDDPEECIGRQLEAWRASDRTEQKPSISGLAVQLPHDTIPQQIKDKLMQEIHQRAKRQLRKDRRVLRIADNQLAWFSPDVSPEDAVMPVERIRQLIDKTSFLCDGRPIVMTINAAIVAGHEEDQGADIVERLKGTIQRATEQQDSPTCLDQGDGPTSVEPLTLEIEETECVLDS